MLLAGPRRDERMEGGAGRLHTGTRVCARRKSHPARSFEQVPPHIYGKARAVGTNAKTFSVDM